MDERIHVYTHTWRLISGAWVLSTLPSALVWVSLCGALLSLLSLLNNSELVKMALVLWEIVGISLLRKISFSPAGVFVSLFPFSDSLLGVFFKPPKLKLKIDSFWLLKLSLLWDSSRSFSSFRPEEIIRPSYWSDLHWDKSDLPPLPDLRITLSSSLSDSILSCCDEWARTMLSDDDMCLFGAGETWGLLVAELRWGWEGVLGILAVSRFEEVLSEVEGDFILRMYFGDWGVIALSCVRCVLSKLCCLGWLDCSSSALNCLCTHRRELPMLWSKRPWREGGGSEPFLMRASFSLAREAAVGTDIIDRDVSFVVGLPPGILASGAAMAVLGGATLSLTT